MMKRTKTRWHDHVYYTPFPFLRLLSTTSHLVPTHYLLSSALEYSLPTPCIQGPAFVPWVGFTAAT